MKFSLGSIVSVAAGALQLTSAFPTTHDVSVASPVPVKSVTCDGSTFKCTATLDFGNGDWVAQWPASVNQQSFARPLFQDFVMMSPVPVKTINCDGSTFECTANLDFGNGDWVATWSSAVFSQSSFRGRTANRVGIMAPAKVTSMTCDGSAFKCTAALQFGDGSWVAQWSTSVFQTGGGLFSQ